MTPVLSAHFGFRVVVSWVLESSGAHVLILCAWEPRNSADSAVLQDIRAEPAPSASSGKKDP